jgi:hypothetical protein
MGAYMYVSSFFSEAIRRATTFSSPLSRICTLLDEHYIIRTDAVLQICSVIALVSGDGLNLRLTASTSKEMSSEQLTQFLMV